MTCGAAELCLKCENMISERRKLLISLYYLKHLKMLLKLSVSSTLASYRWDDHMDVNVNAASLAVAAFPKMFTCHSRKSTGVNNNINNGSILFKCPNLPLELWIVNNAHISHLLVWSRCLVSPVVRLCQRLNRRYTWLLVVLNMESLLKLFWLSHSHSQCVPIATSAMWICFCVASLRLLPS